MTNQEKFDKLFCQNPHPVPGFRRPHVSRRQFMNIAGAGVTASWLASKLPAAALIKSHPVTTKNTAKNVIFIMLAGAPSHTDTFDLKVISGTTPATLKPTTFNDVLWPAGLMPKLSAASGDIALVRSMRSWALVHSLSQTWTQIGRNPAGVLGNVAPNIGSMVAMEKAAERKANQLLPTFVALNSSGAVGSGYLPASVAPLKVSPSNTGLRNTTNADGEARFNSRWDLLHHLDEERVNPNGEPMADFDKFYSEAKGLTYNPLVTNAFRFTAADAGLYGGSGFGNACLIAKQLLAADQGTRYIEITLGGWDMHSNIYTANQLPLMTRTLDNGLSQLIGDLKSAGLFDSTMIVMAGEFGRTTGRLTGAQGRDHYPQQFAFFAGGGVKGGRAIGSTDDLGAKTVDYGWSRQRDVKPEDVEATIYSALGINWTNIRYDDPLGRGFYYVPNSDTDLYGPINELWG